VQARSILLLGVVIGAAILGLGVAAVVLGGAGAPPEIRVQPDLPASPDTSPTSPTGGPTAPEATEARGTVPERPPLPAGFDAPVTTLSDLEPRYDVAMDTTLDLSDVAVHDRTAVARALQDRTFALVSTVDAAAMAHLNYAAKAPRADAAIASQQASELYDHLAEVLSTAKPPSGLPPAEADLQRQVWNRMAQTHRRRAADLRARPVAGRETAAP
jgi:hypothetical protein